MSKGAFARTVRPWTPGYLRRVMTDLQRVGSWLNHLVKARTRHAVHSPFVYDLIDQVLRNSTERPEFVVIEGLREELLDSDQTIRVNDLGAGSRKLDLPVRAVSDMARTALKPAKQAQLLYRLARYSQPANIVELGTSFGISTLYLAQGTEDGVVHTIEGCPQTQRIAQHHFDRMRQRNIRSFLGSFRSKLPEVLKLVLGQGLRLALIGTAIGLAGAWAVARTLRSIVPALSPPEWSTALAAAAILLLTSLVACLIPARRAAKVDPIIALRSE